VRQLQHTGVSPATAFYTARDVALTTRFLRLPPVALTDQFLPQRLEILLDDNYAVRMLCGGPVHEQEASIGLAELRCAQRSLASHYSFVGILEEQAETVCQLTHSLGLRPGAYAPTPRAVHRCAGRNREARVLAHERSVGCGLPLLTHPTPPPTAHHPLPTARPVWAHPASAAGGASCTMYETGHALAIQLIWTGPGPGGKPVLPPGAGGSGISVLPVTVTLQLVFRPHAAASHAPNADRCPAPCGRRYPIPADFELAHARKFIMDNELYKDALNRFFEQRKQYPECVPSPSPPPPDSRS
jgi:hypothetical protein